MIQLDTRFLTTPIAHRALHDVSKGRPENSRAAIQAAIDHGYGIEIDLQMSKDDIPIVFHDYDLSRLSKGSGLLRQHTAQNLGAIPLKGGSEGIPNLSEVLNTIDGQVPLIVEFKDQDGQLGENVGKLEAAAAGLLMAYKGPVAVMSFNPHSVSKLADLCPQIPRGLVTGAYLPEKWEWVPEDVRARLRGIPDYDRVGASFISHELADLDRPRVKELKSAGAQVLCWTVTSKAKEAKAREVADNITFEQYLAKHPA